MDKVQLDKLRSALSKDDDLRMIAEYYSRHKATYTALSVRGVVNGLKAHGSPVGLPKAREFVSALIEAGVGKGVKDEDGNISNVVKLSLNTREIGEAVVGPIKHPTRFKADQATRNIEGTARAVAKSPSEFKIYPMRRASNLSITVTINGKPVIMPLPDDLEPEQLQALIKRLKQLEDGYGK